MSVENTQSRRDHVGQREVSVGNTQSRRGQSSGTCECVSLRVCLCPCERGHVCVRTSVCGRTERDRDILEAREAGELGRRQTREPVAVQREVPVGHR